MARRPEAPFGRDAIHLWYAPRLHTLETARLVHRALNPLPVCRVVSPAGEFSVSEGSANEAADVRLESFG